MYVEHMCCTPAGCQATIVAGQIVQAVLVLYLSLLDLHPFLLAHDKDVSLVKFVACMCVMQTHAYADIYVNTM